MLKEKVIAVQEKRLRKQMMAQSKSDQLLLTSFGFNRNRQGYLDLPFHQAQIIFMVRCRMLLTKCNFPGVVFQEGGSILQSVWVLGY